MSKTCFVITPIGKPDSPERSHADKVWESVLKPVFEKQGYEIVRADKMNDPGQITTAAFKQIAESDVCLADLSFLNPNVMYELGVRHCLRLPVIQIKEETTENPFDTRGQRTIDFDPESDDSLRALSAEIQIQLEWIERNPGSVTNPLTSAFDLSPNAIIAERMEKTVQELGRRLAALELRCVEGTSDGEQDNGRPGEANLSPVEQLRAVHAKTMSDDGIAWVGGEDGSIKAHIAGFDVALRPQSKGRWSSSAVHSTSGFSVTYPTWRASQDEAREAILSAMIEEEPYWGKSK